MKIAEEIGESLLRDLARNPRAVICWTGATLVRIVGHEVLKAMAGKFSPLMQFLAVGYIETLLPPRIEFRQQNCRSICILRVLDARSKMCKICGIS
jgi:hypothetical protein